ncbi:hypothetical protein GIB67_027328 [Kingdonia uniflora]|uniref:Uncharacterized protein n=1 Tax=Kingdonia uniflora TaxID=39325 RepID=A0A7J7MF14_9MAGN|nr:hypothetical protein GIB67_027328 [Kingdonia uniflora]
MVRSLIRILVSIFLTVIWITTVGTVVPITSILSLERFPFRLQMDLPFGLNQKDFLFQVLFSRFFFNPKTSNQVLHGKFL